MGSPEARVDEVEGRAGELELALAIDRRVAARAAAERIALPEGLVVRHPSLPRVHDLNAVRLDAPLARRLDGPAIGALADRWLGHLNHRKVVLDDGPAGERLTSELVRDGWQRSRTVFMVFRGDLGRRPVDPRAREISDDELRAVMLANFEEADYGADASPDLPQMLVEAQSATRDGTPARRFGAGEDGGLQSMCLLFLDPDLAGARVAMVETVGTLRAYRERGLAQAVVSAAVTAGLQWGAELITVPADADDWPQLLYAKLGFEPVGVQVSFLRRLSAL